VKGGGSGGDNNDLPPDDHHPGGPKKKKEEWLLAPFRSPSNSTLLEDLNKKQQYSSSHAIAVQPSYEK